MERVYFIIKILFSGYSIQTVMSLINDVKFVISNLDYEINLISNGDDSFLQGSALHVNKSNLLHTCSNNLI